MKKDKEQNFKNNILYSRILILFFFILAITFGFLYFKEKQDSYNPVKPNPFFQKNLPYLDEVRKVITPLRYSGLPDLLSPSTHISLNFKERTWTLHNIHHFDLNGNVTLLENKYGVCGDLASFAYQKLRTIFPKDRYYMEFAQVAEASYFRYGKGTHYVIRVQDVKKPGAKAMIIDPSLKRYAEEDQFNNYLPLNFSKSIRFVEKKEVNETHAINSGPPVILNRRGLLSIGVKSVGKKFDPDNFLLTIFVAKRFSYISPLAYVVGLQDGKLVEIEYKESLKHIFKKNQYQELKNRMGELFQDYLERSYGL